ncbi:hypothetical protein [Nonomuraea insulae]|uniref:Uncharacterized protein n=1 Tax=Nonomuraea insulae TaxID=1616787 RepID=A0ABW1DE38_9ACTN
MSDHGGPATRALGLGHRREEGGEQAAGPAGVVHAGQRSGEHLQDQAVGGEFGGVAAQALHLVHGEDDPAVRGVGLDLAGQRERGFELGPDAYPLMLSI